MKCIYISKSNGSDQNDGLSPETAKYTLAAALREIEVVSPEDNIAIVLGDDVTFEHPMVIDMEEVKENEDGTGQGT